LSRTPLAALCSIVISISASLLAGCASSTTAPPPPPPSGNTFWLAPNGSEVVLELTTTQQTVPF
jgi:hypothetical protein